MEAEPVSDSSSNELDYEGRGLKRSLETEPVSDSSSNELDYEGRGLKRSLETELVSDSSSNELDYEGMPMGVGLKRNLKVCTYEELHVFIIDIIKVLEEVYELGVRNGTIKEYKKAKSDSNK
jgi:hypothetical protein